MTQREHLLAAAEAIEAASEHLSLAAHHLEETGVSLDLTYLLRERAKKQIENANALRDATRQAKRPSSSK